MGKDLMDTNLSELEMDMLPRLIHERISLGLMHVDEVLRNEVRSLAGDR
jgi:hypothetical protein